MTGPGEAAKAVEDAQREQIRTGAEVQAFNKRVLAEVARYLPDIELRKWAVRRAIEATRPINDYPLTSKSTKANEEALAALKERYIGQLHNESDPKPLVTYVAESLYAFVTAPISEKDTQ